MMPATRDAMEACTFQREDRRVKGVYVGGVCGEGGVEEPTLSEGNKNM